MKTSKILTPQQIKLLAYELGGVIADAEATDDVRLGFDQVSLDTVKRVQGRLFELSEQAHAALLREREFQRRCDMVEAEQARMSAEIMRLNPTYIGP